MDFWSAVELEESGIVACVGAGGKTSVIQSLTNAARQRKQPVVVTSTTRMYVQQVDGLDTVIAGDYTSGRLAVHKRLAGNQAAAWFSARKGDKIIGLPPHWLDEFAQSGLACRILVEADGAAACLIKAPAVHEPVVPLSTAVTVGVLNLQAIGRSLNSSIAHRLPLVTKLLGKTEGATIAWQDLAELAGQPQGIFQYGQGRKVLVLSGGQPALMQAGRSIAAYLKFNFSGFDRCIISSGYGAHMQPLEVHELW